MGNAINLFSAFMRDLMDAADAAAARILLGLGDSATKNVGTAAGTVAAGDAAPNAHKTSHATGGSDALSASDIGAAPAALVEALSDQLLDAQDGALVIEQYADYAYTINELRIIATAGTCTVAVAIDGTPVTGLSAVSVSTAEATGTASAANSVAVGQTVTLTISSASGLGDVAWTMKRTRA